MDNREFQQLIGELYAKGEYRPVAVAVIYDCRRRLLITKTPKKNAQTPWSFPQGGIEQGETLEQSLTRELKEELGIDLAKELRDFRYGFYYRAVDYEPTRQNKRRFPKKAGKGQRSWSRGKAYIFSLAKYVGRGTLKLKPDEVAEAWWVPYDDAIRLFVFARPEKALLLVRALDESLSMLS